MITKYFKPSWSLVAFNLAQQLVKSRYMRVQSYGQTLSINVAKEFAEELQLQKQATVRTWTENGTFCARKAE
jgi:hypothetical protein